MHIHPAKQIYKCFACQAGGNVFSFLMEYEKLTFIEAVRNLADKYGIIIPKENYQQIKETDTLLSLKDMHKLASQIYHKTLFHKKAAKAARSYLNKRKIGQKICEQFEIGYALKNYQFLYDLLKKNFKEKDLIDSGLFFQKEKNPPIDFFRDRIIFPIKNDRGEYVGFGGRAIGDVEPKYLNTRETSIFSKSQLLYGFFQSYQRLLKEKIAYVVEGYLDVISMQIYDLPAVAPLGTSLTIEQIKKLKRYAEKIFLIFDGDSAGVRAAIRSSVLLMECSVDGYVLILPDKTDPFDFLQNKGIKKFKDFLTQNQLDIYQFYIEQSIPDRELTPAEKKKYLEKILTEIQNIKDEVIRNDILYKVSEKLQVESNTVQQISKEKQAKQDLRNASRLSQKKEDKNKPLYNRLHRDFVLFLVYHPQYIKKAKSIISTKNIWDQSASLIYQTLLTHNIDQNSNFQTILDLFVDPKAKEFLTHNLFSFEEKFKDKENKENALEKFFEDHFCRIRIDALEKKTEKKLKVIEENPFINPNEINRLQEEISLHSIEMDELYQRIRN